MAIKKSGIKLPDFYFRGLNGHSERSNFGGMYEI